MRNRSCCLLLEHPRRPRRRLHKQHRDGRSTMTLPTFVPSAAQNGNHGFRTSSIYTVCRVCAPFLYLPWNRSHKNPRQPRRNCTENTISKNSMKMMPPSRIVMEARACDHTLTHTHTRSRMQSIGNWKECCLYWLAIYNLLCKFNVRSSYLRYSYVHISLYRIIQITGIIPFAN